MIFVLLIEDLNPPFNLNVYFVDRISQIIDSLYFVLKYISHLAFELAK